MANFKQDLIKAEINRKIDEQKAGVRKQIEADAQCADFKRQNKYNQILGEFAEKSKQFKRIQGFETPMVLYLDMTQMWIDWIEVWKMAAPSLLADFIKLLPKGELVLGIANESIKQIQTKMVMLRQNGFFNDPKVVMPLVVHAVELDANNKLNPESLKSFSTGTNITPELQTKFNESIELWLGQGGYKKCEEKSAAAGCVPGCFYSDLSKPATLLTQDAFKVLRDDPVEGLNANFQQAYDIELAKSPSPRP